MLERSASCFEDPELFRVIACLICLAREGLQAPGDELARCLERANNPKWTVLQVHDVLVLLGPFTRNTGSIVAGSQTFVDAVKDGFLSGPAGKARMEGAFDMLFNAFCAWLDGDGAGQQVQVTRRLASEFPYVLQMQVELLDEKKKALDPSETTKLAELEVQRNAKCALMKKFLHRLDTFHLLYQQDNPRLFLRFQALSPVADYLNAAGQVRGGAALRLCGGA